MYTVYDVVYDIYLWVYLHVYRVAWLSFQDGYKQGKFCLLPFDKFYEKDGTPNEAKTTFYIPNDYSFMMAREHPEYFHPVGSVNPYRKDALEELERCHRNGVTIIKWLVHCVYDKQYAYVYMYVACKSSLYIKIQ